MDCRKDVGDLGTKWTEVIDEISEIFDGSSEIFVRSSRNS